MSDSVEARLKREIDKISRDIKQIMERVEALYPSKKPQNEPENASGADAPGESGDSQHDEKLPDENI